MLKISYDLAAGAWFEPDYTLGLAAETEKARFDAVWSGDHVLPWFHTHAHVPQNWVMLTAAAERTKKIPVGSDVTVPMFKYHPIVVAQAFATMGRLYPGRILLGVGTGEAINEAPFLTTWPSWQERAETLVESLTLMRKFWTSQDYFDFEGKHFQVRGIFCYDKPKKPLPIYWSAFGPKSAYLAGQHADHLMTAVANVESARNSQISIISKFKEGMRSAGKDPEKAELSVYIDGGYGQVNKLLKKYRFCAGAMIPENTNEKDPRKIEASASQLTDDFILERVCLTSSPSRLVELFENNLDLGFNHIIFGDWGYNPLATIRMFGKKILPRFRRLKHP
jgi:coenzyme F420-dependent glucose-6-phosphate dehydrogenase